MSGFTKLFRLGIVALVMTLPACSSATVAPTTTPFPPTSISVPPTAHRIAFNSDNSIYIINADGNNLMQVVKRGGGSVWSPDGRFIAFGNGQIYITKIEDLFQSTVDNNSIQLTHVKNLGSSMTWSPNGQEIAFASYTGDNTGKIYVIDVEKAISTNGKNAVRQINQFGVDAKNLNWSPNGKYLTFYYRVDYRTLLIIEPQSPPRARSF